MTTTSDARVDFGQGLPDLNLVPADDLRRCFDAVLTEGGGQACGYYGAGGSGEMKVGCLELRESVARFLSGRDGISLSADQVILAHGSTDGLATAADAYCSPGDGAVVEEVTYHHMVRYMTDDGATIARAPLDATGIDIEAVEQAMRRLADGGTPPTVIYTIPSFQSPTGTVLPLDRRLALLEIAHRYGAVIVEDAAYHDLWYDAAPPTSLLGLDPYGVVVLSGTFSKLLAPGLRLAWLAGPAELIARVAAARRDFSVNHIAALAVARYCDEGLLGPHIEMLRHAYKAKRDAVVEGLQRHCSQWGTFDVPTGGFYIWMKLAPSVDVATMRRLSEEHGLGVRTGEMFGGGSDYRTRAVRLSVAQVPLERIEPGTALLGQVLRQSAGG